VLFAESDVKMNTGS